MILFGHLAITTASIPALMFLCLFVGLCAWQLQRSQYGVTAPIILGLLLAGVVTLGAVLTLPVGAAGLTVPYLVWPFVAFLVGYGIWRVAGGAPLRNWPWFRFGALVATTIATADVVLGLIVPVPQGRAWILGGAGFTDGLGLIPPFLTASYWALLDCRSPLTFCSSQCRDADRCRFGLDGKQPDTCHNRSA